MREVITNLPLEPRTRIVNVQLMAHPPQALLQGDVQARTVDWAGTISDMVLNQATTVEGARDIQAFANGVEADLYDSQNGRHARMMRTILDLQRVRALVLLC